MKKNKVKIGDLVLQLGFPIKKSNYFTEVVKLGEQGSEEEIKVCEIVRVDARNNCSRISLANGSFIRDPRSVKKIAMLLPYNHFGYYRVGCIFNMHLIEDIDRKTMTVILKNGTTVKIEIRSTFDRFDDDFYNLNR